VRGYAGGHRQKRLRTTALAIYEQQMNNIISNTQRI